MTEGQEEDMENVFQFEVFVKKEAISLSDVKEGAIILDRMNPVHRMWIEDDKE